MKCKQFLKENELSVILTASMLYVQDKIFFYSNKPESTE